MNKKLVKILAISAAVIVVVVTGIIIGVSCGKKAPESKFNPMVESSRQATNNVVVSAQLKDGEVVVNKYKETIKIDVDGMAIITKEKSQLNPNFDFSTTSENESVQIDRSKLLAFDLTEANMKNVEFKDDVLTFTADDVSKIVLAQSIQGSTNGNFTVTFKDSKITSIDCSFTLTSGKTMVINVTCAY